MSTQEALRREVVAKEDTIGTPSSRIMEELTICSQPDAISLTQ